MENKDEFKAVAEEFRSLMNELIDQFLILDDVEGLQGLVRAVKGFQKKRLEEKRKK